MFDNFNPKLPLDLSAADRLFVYFWFGILTVLLLYGIGMTIVVIVADQSLGLRMISAFASMFAAALGFGSGYLVARRQNGNGNGKDRK